MLGWQPSASSPLTSFRSARGFTLLWLKAIGYAGLFRHQDMTAVMNQLDTVLMRRCSGTVDDLARELFAHDRAAVYGAAVRAAIQSNILN